MFRAYETDPTSIWVPTGWATGWGGIAYPAGADTNWLIWCHLPESWMTWIALPVWAVSATSGTVRWNVQTAVIEPGFAPMTANWGDEVIDVAGFAPLLPVELAGGWLISHRTDKPWRHVALNLTRKGTADTNPGPVYLWGVRLVRRS